LEFWAFGLAHENAALGTKLLFFPGCAGGAASKSIEGRALGRRSTQKSFVPLRGGDGGQNSLLYQGCAVVASSKSADGVRLAHGSTWKRFVPLWERTNSPTGTKLKGRRRASDAGRSDWRRTPIGAAQRQETGSLRSLTTINLLCLAAAPAADGNGDSTSAKNDF